MKKYKIAVLDDYQSVVRSDDRIYVGADLGRRPPYCDGEQLDWITGLYENTVSNI